MTITSNVYDPQQVQKSSQHDYVPTNYIGEKSITPSMGTSQRSNYPLPASE